MQKKEDLIRENIELRARLELAKKWMRRQVASSIAKIQKESTLHTTKKNLTTTWKENGVDIITAKILHQFSSVLPNAPKFTLERLIDAEIYWHTLQEYPHMDALPIVLAYQKIFDSWIEHSLISQWRNQSGKMIISETDSLDRDIQNIITKKYSLSIGRFYQIISLIRNEGELSSAVQGLVDYWNKQHPGLVDMLQSDVFWIPFSSIMEREIWSKKRHESKVNYSDARITRDIMLGVEGGNNGLLHQLLVF